MDDETRWTLFVPISFIVTYYVKGFLLVSSFILLIFNPLNCDFANMVWGPYPIICANILFFIFLFLAGCIAPQKKYKTITTLFALVISILLIIILASTIGFPYFSETLYPLFKILNPFILISAKEQTYPIIILNFILSSFPAYGFSLFLTKLLSHRNKPANQLSLAINSKELVVKNTALHSKDSFN